MEILLLKTEKTSASSAPDVRNRRYRQRRKMLLRYHNNTLTSDEKSATIQGEVYRVITQEVIDYIRSQKQQQVSENHIINALSSQGWQQRDIDEALYMASNPSAKPQNTPDNAIPANNPKTSSTK